MNEISKNIQKMGEINQIVRRNVLRKFASLEDSICLEKGERLLHEMDNPKKVREVLECVANSVKRASINDDLDRIWFENKRKYGF